MSRDAVFEVSDGPDAGARFPLGDEVMRIGRDPAANEVVLHDPRVSRRHARVWVSAGLLMFQDLGSTGGSLVNDIPLRRATPLRVGDRLTLGDTTLTVLWTPARQAAGRSPG